MSQAISILSTRVALLEQARVLACDLGALAVRRWFNEAGVTMLSHLSDAQLQAIVDAHTETALAA